MNLRKAIMGTAVAVALAVPAVSNAATGVFFNNAGTGGINAGTFTSQFNWDDGVALCQGCIGLGNYPLAGTIYSQTTLAASQGGVTKLFTYQFGLPVTTTFVAGLADGQFSNIQVFNDTTRTGFFRMFVTTPGSTNEGTGLGFGDVAGPQSLILSGEIRLDKTFALLQTNPSLDISATGTDVTAGSLNKSTASTIFGGKATLDIDVKPDSQLAVPGSCDGTLTDATCVDNNYFTSDISSLILSIGLNTTADGSIGTFGVGTPFATGDNASGSVVGQIPSLGAPQAVIETVTPTVDNLPPPRPFTGPLNDFFCNVHTVIGPVVIDAPGPGPCDVMGATSGNMKINDTAAPEPATMALLGLGLGALGFSTRRRRKSVA